jgi:TetR/AcrR family transcriptional regulator, transcriptional repressor of bet genes
VRGAMAPSGPPERSAPPAARPRTRASPVVRHEELIQATLRCLTTVGPVGTSVRAIAKEAGVSPGLVTYHFGGKRELLVGAYRYLSDQMRRAEARALQDAGDDPHERLMAFIGVGFGPEFLDEGYITARFLFWGLARTDPDVARVHDEIYAAYRRALGALLEAAIGPRPENERLGFALSALLDGLWLDWCLDPRSFDPADMMAECRRMIAGVDRTRAGRA